MGFQTTNMDGLNKADLYAYLSQSLEALLAEESNWLANCANTIALIQSHFQFHWIGFYWVEKEELVLGCFQGPVACTRIAYGKGVCGESWRRNAICNVPNVHEFPGHIACSDKSNSELVVPINDQSGRVIGVLDIDSESFSSFDEIDEKGMNDLLEILMRKWRE